MIILKVRGKLLDVALGTLAADKELFETYIASLAPDAKTREEEIAAHGVDVEIERSMTVFPRLNGKPDGQPFLWPYQLKGLLKAAATALNRVSGTETKATKAFKKILTDTVFISPDKIPFEYEGAEQGITGTLSRPLRAEGPQGVRVTLACSQTIPAGATFDFEIRIMDDSNEVLVLEALEYVKFQGLHQWRNSGHGRVEF